MSVSSKTRKGSSVNNGLAKPSEDKSFWNPRGTRKNDGITFSLLSNFLECRKRFGFKVIDGFREKEGFKFALEYGNLWHLAEEWHARGEDWRPHVKAYYNHLLETYMDEKDEVTDCAFALSAQFPVYVDYYKKRTEGSKKRIPIMQEYAFNERIEFWDDYVQLRGKLDEVFGIEHKGQMLVYIKENKTKNKIDEPAIPATLFCNLQTGVYSNAVRTLLRTKPELFPKNSKFAGVVFNVVRTPHSGIPPCGPRPEKGETKAEFWHRHHLDIVKRPRKYFYEWTVPLSEKDTDWFNAQSFHPILKQLTVWYDWRTNPGKFSPAEASIARSLDFQYPWGMWNSLNLGFRGSYYDYLTAKNVDSLVAVKTLFPELENPF